MAAAILSSLKAVLIRCSKSSLGRLSMRAMCKSVDMKAVRSVIVKPLVYVE